MAALIAAHGRELNRPFPAPLPHGKFCVRALAGKTICSDNPARTRKLIGTIVLLVFLALYAWAAAAIGAGRITLAPAWAQFAYFLTAGLAWVLPAALLIRWMQRPD